MCAQCYAAVGAPTEVVVATAIRAGLVRNVTYPSRNSIFPSSRVPSRAESTANASTDAVTATPITPALPAKPVTFPTIPSLLVQSIRHSSMTATL